MTTAAPAATTTEVEGLRHHARMTRLVVAANTEGVTHEESLLQPAPGGNCLNWVVGHLLTIYSKALLLLGQQPVLDAATQERYDRGSPALRDGAEAMRFEEMLAAWETTCDRIDTGLASLTPEALDRPAPFSPSGNPDETIRSLVGTILFHQAYHAGQTGILRRLTGKEGAIR